MSTFKMLNKEPHQSDTDAQNYDFSVRGKYIFQCKMAS